MRRTSTWLLGTLTLVLSAWLRYPDHAAAQPQPVEKTLTTKDIMQAEKGREKTRKILKESLPIKPFLDLSPLTLETLTAEIEKQLPAGKKISFHLSGDALGPVVKTTIKKLPTTKEISVANLLKFTLSQVHTAKLVYHVEPGFVRITTPDSDNTPVQITYDVGDLAAQSELWRPGLKANAVISGPIAPPGDTSTGIELLARVICLNVAPEHWQPAAPKPGKMGILNGSKLVIDTSSANHKQIQNFVFQLAELAATSVTIDSGLYAVPQELYVKEIAPLVINAAQKGQPWLTAAPAALADKIRGEKRIAEGDKIKIASGSNGAVFLSWHKAYNYQAEPKDNREPFQIFKTMVDGVSFHAQVHVAPDRDWLMLKVTQSVKELVELKKTEVLNLGDGKKAVIDVPNLRENLLTGSLGVNDHQSFLMPVDHPAPVSAGKDCLLVLLATPTIWVGDEPKAQPGGVAKEVDSDKQARELYLKFCQAVNKKDPDAVLKTVDVPWLESGKPIVKNREELQKVWKEILSNPDIPKLPLTKVKVEPLAALREAVKENKDFLARLDDLHLTKNDCTVNDALTIFIVRVHNGEAKIVGAYHVGLKIDGKIFP